MFCLLAWLTAAPALAAAEPARVVFLSPDTSRFWGLVSGFMQAVADDLDVKLEVVTDQKRHRLSYLQLAEEVLARPDKPEYLVFMCKENVTARMVALASEAGVKVFTFNTDVPEETRELLGLPREQVANWIGHLAPDNVGGGKALAQLLGQQARQLTGRAPATAPSMIALTGNLNSSAATDRNLGLLTVVESQEAALSQLVHADWSEAEAHKKTRVLLKRYPTATAIWNASDGMALGAIAAARSAGLQPGVDLVVGGIDWEPRALAAIRDGDLAVSLGRHFMGGGLLMLLLHDYHRGADFAGSSAMLSYQLEPATRSNLAWVERILDPGNWQRVRFDQFSRALNPDRSREGQSADALLDAFAAALNDQGAVASGY